MGPDGNTGGQSIGGARDGGWTNFERRGSTPHYAFSRVVSPHGDPPEPINRKLTEIAAAAGLTYFGSREVSERIITLRGLVRIDGEGPQGYDGPLADLKDNPPAADRDDAIVTERWARGFQLGPRRYFFGWFGERTPPKDSTPFAHIVFSTVRWRLDGGNNCTSIIAKIVPSKALAINAAYFRLRPVAPLLVEECATWFASFPAPQNAAAARHSPGLAYSLERPPGEPTIPAAAPAPEPTPPNDGVWVAPPRTPTVKVPVEIPRK